jgi:multiple sugar transport system permease protein
MKRGRWQAYLFLAPAAVLLLTFSIYPLFNAAYLSTHTQVDETDQRFVGLENYKELLDGGEFWSSLGITTWYVIGTVPIALLLSFFIANLLFQKLRGLGLFRTIYFLPYVTSTVAAAMVWRWIFSPGERGAANVVLDWFGIDPQRWYYESAGIFQLVADNLDITLPAWAAGPSLALVCVMIFSIWHMLGFDVVIFLAGLSAIPRETYEAADVDGANSLQKMRHITLPLLTPTLFFLGIISVIRSFQTFNQIYVMTREESVGCTQNLTMLIYNKSIVSFDHGQATAVAVMLFLIIMALTLFQMKVLGRRVHY